MRPRLKKRANAQPRAWARKSQPKKLLPSMLHWLTHWDNCESSGVVTTDPSEIEEIDSLASLAVLSPSCTAGDTEQTQSELQSTSFSIASPLRCRIETGSICFAQDF